MTDEMLDATPVVADLLSGDTKRILSAVWQVIATRDPEVYGPLVLAEAPIRTATADVDLGGAIASNRDHLAHALARVTLFGEGTCLCAAYPGHPFYDPAKEVERGHVTVTGSVANDRQWEPDRICVCTNCGRTYQVESGEHHVPWWAWRERPQA